MLTEAVGLLRDSVGRRPARPGRLPRPPVPALAEMSGWTGEQADLDEAITAERDAVAGARAAGTDQILGLTNLTAALTRRFEQSGTPRAWTRRSTRSGRPRRGQGQPAERATILVSLGHTLVTRYGQTGEMADLDESVTRLRVAADQLPAGHPDRPPMLGNLCGVLLYSARARRDAAAAGAAQARAAHATERRRRDRGRRAGL